MKKIMLVLVMLMCLCCSCFASFSDNGEWHNNPQNWISCGSKWEFDGNNLIGGSSSNSIGFSDYIILVSLIKETPYVITHCVAHLEPHSLNPYLFKVQRMNKFYKETGKDKDIVPPNPASFDNPVLARAICKYADIDIR